MQMPRLSYVVPHVCMLLELSDLMPASLSLACPLSLIVCVCVRACVSQICIAHRGEPEAQHFLNDGMQQLREGFGVSGLMLRQDEQEPEQDQQQATGGRGGPLETERETKNKRARRSLCVCACVWKGREGSLTCAPSSLMTGQQGGGSSGGGGGNERARSLWRQAGSKAVTVNLVASAAGGRQLSGQVRKGGGLRRGRRIEG
jgi:hypothetical protein